MRNLLAVVLMSLVVAVPGTAHAWGRSDPTRLDGEINPEYKGQSYQSYVVGAVNVVPLFRKQLEAWHVKRINHGAKNSQAARQFQALFSRTDFSSDNVGKTYTLEEIKQKLDEQGIQIFVFINVKDTGGANLTDVDTMDKALLAAANTDHDGGKITHYGSTDTVLYELATGKVVWRGNGVVKAKPETPKWFKRTSAGHAKFLEKRLRSARLLKAQGETDVATEETKADQKGDPKLEADDKVAEPQEDKKKEQDI